MKHLILMRHASAGPGADDRARPLSSAGRGDALRVGRALERLAASGFRPEWALVSPALRAQETLEAVRSALRSLAGAETEEALYLASADQLLARLRRVPEETAQLLLVGHNPGLTELMHALAGRGADAVRARAAQGLPPGACAALRIEDLRWRELERGCAELVDLVTPRLTTG